MPWADEMYRPLTHSDIGANGKCEIWSFDDCDGNTDKYKRARIDLFSTFVLFCYQWYLLETSISILVIDFNSSKIS